MLSETNLPTRAFKSLIEFFRLEAAGGIMWVAVLKSGVHATLAGVVLGLCIPLGSTDEDAVRPSEKLEHFLHPWVAYFILPLFAFANAGVSLKGIQ